MQWTVKKAGAAVTTGALTLAAITQCSAGLFDDLFHHDKCFLQKDDRSEVVRRLPARDCSFGFFDTRWRPWNTCCADAECAPRSGSDYAAPIRIDDPYRPGHTGTIREEVRVLENYPDQYESTYPQRSYDLPFDSSRERQQDVPEIRDQYQSTPSTMMNPPAGVGSSGLLPGPHSLMLQPPADSQRSQPIQSSPTEPQKSRPQPVLTPPPGDDTPVDNESSQFQPIHQGFGPGGTSLPINSVPSSIPGFVPGQAPGGFVYQGQGSGVPNGIPLPDPVQIPAPNGQFVPPQIPGVQGELDFSSPPAGGVHHQPVPPTPSGIPAEASYGQPGAFRQLQPATHWQGYQSSSGRAVQPQFQTSGYQPTAYQPLRIPAHQQFDNHQFGMPQSGIPNTPTGGSGYREMPAQRSNSADDAQWRVMRGAFGPQEPTNPSDRVVFIPGPQRR